MGFSFSMESEAFDKSGTFEALPEGNYDLEVVEAEVKTASTGTDMLAVQFKVLDGEYANRRVFRNYPITAKAIGFLKALYAACQLDLPVLVENGRVELNIEPGEFIGCQVAAVVTVRDYTDSTGVAREGNDLKNMRPLKKAAAKADNKAVTKAEAAPAAPTTKAAPAASSAREKRL